MSMSLRGVDSPQTALPKRVADFTLSVRTSSLSRKKDASSTPTSARCANAFSAAVPSKTAGIALYYFFCNLSQ